MALRRAGPNTHRGQSPIASTPFRLHGSNRWHTPPFAFQNTPAVHHSAKDAFYPRTPFRSSAWISRTTTTVNHIHPSTAIYASINNHIRATEAPTTATPTATDSQHIPSLVPHDTSSSPGPIPCTAPPATYNPTTHPWPAPYQPQQFPQQSHPPPLYQQPVFRGDPTQPQQLYQTPPVASSEPVRILYDSDGRPLPPAQQPYCPEDDPWNNYGN